VAGDPQQAGRLPEEGEGRAGEALALGRSPIREAEGRSQAATRLSTSGSSTSG
jgi:hypothetical protein